MKRKFAVIMSAALAAGSTMPVMAESETTFIPSTYVGEFSLTAEGESMIFSVIAEQFAEDGVSVSANVTLPASVTGEETDTVYGLNDVLRIVSGDLYINVAEIASTYGELSGSDISSMLSMFGIDQDWVEIPAMDFAAVETEAETDFDVDSMMNEFTALAENFDIQTAEDGSTTITFDGPAIVNTVKAVENVVDNAMAVLLSQIQGTDASQLVTVLDDYLQAAAEGINMAEPDVSVEDAKGMIVDMMNSLVEEMVSSFDVTPLQTEDGSKLSDQIQQMLDEGATINGTATVNADGTMTENVTVVNGESTVVVDMSFDGTAFNYVVTEDGTEIMNANGTITVQDNGFGMDMTATEDGETVTMNVALTFLDNGLSLALTANDGTEEVSMAGSFTQEDGVTITDTEAPTATLLRDVVKNTVAMFYAAQEPVEEETAVTVVE